MIGQRTVSRGVFRAWHFKQWRSHHRVQTFMPIHQYNRFSMRKVRVVPRWQETVEWQACMIQGRMSRGDVDADGLAVQLKSSTPHRARLGGPRRRRGRVTDEKVEVVVGRVQPSFTSQFLDV